MTLQLPEPVERRLAERAAEAGQTVEAFALTVIAREGAGPRTFDEILAPFRRSVAESGMTEQELDDFFQEVREEVWQEQQGKKA